MKLFKKIICLIVCLALCFSLAGCVEDAPTKETGGSESNSSVSDEPKDQVFALNETAVFDDLKITATEVKESKGESFLEPDAGNVFVGVNFTIENISDEEQTVSSLLLFDAYVDDISCDYSFTGATAFKQGVDGTIAPGKKIVGWYAVEVPENWQKLELDVQANWLSSVNARFEFTK